MLLNASNFCSTTGGIKNGSHLSAKQVASTRPPTSHTEESALIIYQQFGCGEPVEEGGLHAQIEDNASTTLLLHMYILIYT